MRRARGASGTALVEFVWLAILLIVPLLYIVLGRLRHPARCVRRVGGGPVRRERAFVTAPNQATSYARAREAVKLAYGDQKIDTAPGGPRSPAGPTRATASLRGRWCAPRSTRRSRWR